MQACPTGALCLTLARRCSTPQCTHSEESSVPHGQVLTHPTYFLPMFMLRRQLHGMAQCVFVVDRSRYNWGAQNGFPKALFLSRMLLGAVLPELTFRMISAKERKRLSTSS